MKRLIMLALLLSAGIAGAADAVRPFVSGSLAQILAARNGKPLILAFWSVTCMHCPAELKALGEFKRRYPNMDLVLVAADTPAQIAATLQMTKKYRLEKAEQWIFADDIPERLRFEIDRRWHGELPHTQFYDREHQVEAKSGRVDPRFIQAWLSRNMQHFRQP